MKRHRETPETIHPEKRKRLPMQPIVIAKDGYARFQANRIVVHLLDNGGLDLNDLARLEFPRSDWEQFAQLIGYSVSGFGELSYARASTVGKADERAGKLNKPPE